MGNSFFGGSRQINAEDMGKKLLSGIAGDADGSPLTKSLSGSTGTTGFQSLLSQAGGAWNAGSIIDSLNSENVQNVAQEKITQLLNGEAGQTGVLGQTGSGTATGDNFVSALSGFIDSVNDKNSAAEQASQDIMTGKSDNIHQAMISMQEASISFDLLVQVRDKLVDAYKELSQMSV